MHIGLTYDLREERLREGWSEQAVAEFDRADTIDALEGAIRAHGHTVERIGHVHALVDALAQGRRWDFVFNVAESFGGPGREALVPALLDSYGVPYSFGDPLVCAVTLDKPTTKHVFRDRGVATPEFAVVEAVGDVDRVDMAFPLFAKPAREGSSKGVGPDSVAHSRAELRAVCARLLLEFAQPVLVERYLPGREATVGIVGSGDAAHVVGVLEVVLTPEAESGVYTYENKERCEELVDYRLVAGPEASSAAAIGLRAYQTIGCRDAGRVDVRQDEHGQWQVIEVNALPGLHPTHSDLPIMATLAGWSYHELIGRILASALSRAGAPAEPVLCAF